VLVVLCVQVLIECTTNSNNKKTIMETKAKSRPPPQGILRKTPTAKKVLPDAAAYRSLGQLGSPSSVHNGVHFEPPSNLQELLVRAADKDGRDLKANAELEGLITHFRDRKGPALVAWLSQIQLNVAVLKPRMEYFVLALLRIGWADQEQAVVAAYTDFLVNLVTAQTYFTRPVVKMLVCNFLGVANRTAVVAAGGGGSGSEAVDIDTIERRVFENTHQTLKTILKISPLAGEQALLRYSKECLPYHLTPFTKSHTNYLTNMLRISGYSRRDRVWFLAMVVDRLVLLDAHIDKELLEEEVEKEGEQDSGILEMTMEEARKSPHLMAKTNLDSGMEVLLAHISQQIEAGEACCKTLYLDLVRLFESHISMVHCGHVQFAMFYLLGKRPAFTSNFLDFLWNKFQSPNTPAIIRKIIVFYIAGLTSRAKYVSVHALMACLEKMTSWIHGYINSSTTADSTSAMSSRAVSCHGSFYAACQAVFYMFAFRHEELTASKRAINFLRSLHFNTIVTSRLNPLYYCLHQVVRNFSALARNYQLAYCETIIQRNSRICLPVVDGYHTASLSSHRDKDAQTNNMLDAYFPFDPYRLPKSKHLFQEFYREYQGGGCIEDDDDEDSSSGGSEDESDVDDSLEQRDQSCDGEEGDKEMREDSEDSVGGGGGRKRTNNEMDDFLMEIEAGLETPQQPNAAAAAKLSRSKRRRTESTLSVGSIDFSYGTSPGFKH